MKNNYPITATFIDEISVDIPSANWNEKQWKKDLDYMKKVGIDTLVFIRGGLNGKCLIYSDNLPTYYKKGEDFLGFMLKEAEKRKMKVFIGLYKKNENWSRGDYQEMTDLNKIFVKEIVKSTEIIRVFTAGLFLRKYVVTNCIS